MDQVYSWCGCLWKKGSALESQFQDTISSNSPNPTPVSFLLPSSPTNGGPERNLHSHRPLSPVRSLYLESSMVTLHYSSQKSFPVNFVHYHFFFPRWRQLYQWPDNVGNIGHDITFWTAVCPALSKHPMGKIVSVYYREYYSVEYYRGVDTFFNQVFWPELNFSVRQFLR